MLATMSRTDDIIRTVRPYRGEVIDDNKEIAYPSALAISNAVQPPVREEIPSQPSNRSGVNTKVLTEEETIELARQAVDNGLEETIRSLAGTEAVDDMVRPKLTIDLGHSNVGSIPESLVDIIKDEVAR